MHAEPAPPHPRRKPINWQADDVQRALAHKAPPLRDVVEHYRSLMNAQELRIDRGEEALKRNRFDRSAINPQVERGKLKEIRDVLHHLLHALEQIDETPTAADCGNQEHAT